MEMFSWKGEVPGLQDFVNSDRMYTGEAVLNLERQLGEASTVFSSKLAALNNLLRVLDQPGVRRAIIPITAKLQTLMACLDSGVMPITVDIDPETLQFKHGELADVLEQIDDRCTIVHDVPPIVGLDTEILDLYPEHNHVYIPNTLPFAPMLEHEALTAHVYDFLPAVDSGAVVFATTEDLVKALHTVRSFTFTEPTALTAFVAAQRLRPFGANNYLVQLSEQVRVYVDNLGPAGFYKPNAKMCRYYPVRVNNLDQCMAALALEGIPSVKAVHSLLDLELLAGINNEDGKLSEGVDAVKDHILGLPINLEISPTKVISILKECGGV